jgi:hypothetical protein
VLHTHYLLPLPGLIFFSFGTFLSKFLLSARGVEALAGVFFRGDFIFLVMSTTATLQAAFHSSFNLSHITL